MKFINKIQKFMYGRYGIDNLYNFLITLYLIVLVLNLFFRNIIIDAIEILLFIIIFYRFLSKNISKRRKENDMYLKIKRKIQSPIKTYIKRKKDKNYVYKKCHKCKKILKLPVPTKRGIKTVKCPKCNKKNKVIVLKKMKTKIIIDN